MMGSIDMGGESEMPLSLLSSGIFLLRKRHRR